MCGDVCETKELQNVSVQENGWIRNSRGYIIGRISEDIKFDSEHLTDPTPTNLEKLSVALTVVQQSVEDNNTYAQSLVDSVRESCFPEVTLLEGTAFVEAKAKSLAAIAKLFFLNEEAVSSFENPIAQHMQGLTEAMQKDEGYAYSWHCNIAMALHDNFADNPFIVELEKNDSINVHTICNEAATLFMKRCFDVKTAYIGSDKPEVAVGEVLAKAIPVGEGDKVEISRGDPAYIGEKLIAYQVGENDMVAAYNEVQAINVYLDQVDAVVGAEELEATDMSDSLDSIMVDEEGKSIDDTLRSILAGYAKASYLYGWE